MTTPLIAHRQWETMVQDRLITGITDRFELRIYDDQGSLERLIRSPSRDAGVSDDEWQDVIDATIAERDDTPEARRNVMRLAETAPRPPNRPAFAGLAGDSEGYVWVRPFRPDPGPTEPWTVVDLDGPVLGTVDLPAGFRPLEIGPDYVLGVARDDLDVSYIRLYALER